jgi:hypothetical protein
MNSYFLYLILNFKTTSSNNQTRNNEITHSYQLMKTKAGTSCFVAIATKLTAVSSGSADRMKDNHLVSKATHFAITRNKTDHN